MGCISSKEEAQVKPKEEGNNANDPKGNNNANASSASLQPQIIVEGPLTANEIKSRIVSGASKHIIKNKEGKEILKLDYAYVSQRGYYPEDLEKANQDQFLVQTDFTDDGTKSFFGVFDGHGKYGDRCSIFARDKVADILKKHPLFKTDFMKAYEDSFVETNKQLHKQRSVSRGIDDSMSGTTAITVVFDQKDIYVANVGDSRAIVCTEEDESKKRLAFALSIDQTPFRIDERKRCMAAGARVLTMDQIDGIKDANNQQYGNEEDDEGDPPRLWLPDKRYPGTAFTRSIGDSVAETVGVHAVPEILVKTLESRDKFLVIASDGVFEFLSNQSVADMVNKFAKPLDAAMAIVAESYRLWLQFEVRTDDITAIVIHLQDTDHKSDESLLTPLQIHKNLSVVEKGGLSKTYSKDNMSDSEKYLRNKNARPVRRTITRAKRMEINSGLSATLTEEEMSFVPPTTFLGTNVERGIVDQAIRACFLFQHLNDSQREGVFCSMKKEEVKEGAVIINQGDVGEKFYIVEKGEFDVMVIPKTNDGEINMPVIVHTYSATSGQYPSFGELALMYDKPRAASVKAKTDGVLWALSRTAFRSIVMKDSNDVLMKTLGSVSVLKQLDKQQLNSLADGLSQVRFNDGDFIIKQGDVGDTFYIIKNGNVKVTKKEEGEEEGKEVMRLSVNAYFGERALISGDKRAASVIAQGPVTCLHIGRSTFEEIIGPLQDIIDADRRNREKVSLLKLNCSKKCELLNLGISPRHTDFDNISIIHKSEINCLKIVRHKISGKMFTLEEIHKYKAVEEKRSSQIIHGMIRNLEYQENNTKSFIPEILQTFADASKLFCLYDTIAVCNMETLQATLGNKMTEEQVGFYAVSLILAFKQVHSHGMHYRCGYPEQILINRDGYPLLMNFKFAKDTLNKSYTICGSPDYFSPETVNQGGADYTSDWWSLGIMICEMLTGKVPFSYEGITELDIYENITNFKYGGVVMPEISEDLQSLVNELLHPDSKQRLGVGESGPASGADQILKHKWIKKNVNIESIKDRTHICPHVEIVLNMYNKFIDEKGSDIIDDIAPQIYNGKEDWYKDW